MTESSLSSLAAGVIASNIFLNPGPFLTIDGSNGASPYIEYKLALSSYGEHASVFAAAYLPTVRSSSLESFYATLLSQQERLGQEFERVLFDNLWDLYAR